MSDKVTLEDIQFHIKIISDSEVADVSELDGREGVYSYAIMQDVDSGDGMFEGEYMYDIIVNDNDRTVQVLFDSEGPEISYERFMFVYKLGLQVQPMLFLNEDANFTVSDNIEFAEQY